jgi:uncharacterized protein YkwD
VGDARRADHGKTPRAPFPAPAQGSRGDQPPTEPGPAARGASGVGCSGTDLQPTAANLGAVNAAIVCLINVERTTRGLRPVAANPRLARAGLAHSRDMVARAYFAHDSLSGRTFVARIRTAGYFRRTRGWTVGENLAWGTYGEATPAAIVHAWMASPPHRANILNGRFREVGIGTALGAPQAGLAGGATYSSEFGARTR